MFGVHVARINAHFSIMPVICRWVLLLVLMAGTAEEAVAQDPLVQWHRDRILQQAPSDVPSFDAKGLRAVYRTEAPAFRGMMRGADRSAYPVFIGAPVLAWGGAWLIRGGDDWSSARARI